MSPRGPCVVLDNLPIQPRSKGGPDGRETSIFKSQEGVCELRLRAECMGLSKGGFPFAPRCSFKTPPFVIGARACRRGASPNPPKSLSSPARRPGGNAVLPQPPTRREQSPARGSHSLHNTRMESRSISPGSVVKEDSKKCFLRALSPVLTATHGVCATASSSNRPRARSTRKP